MITQTSAVAFRQNLGEMLNLVQYRHDSVVINKDGKPVAALVDARLFERIRRMQGRFDALRLATSADLYRLHLTVARLLDDPKRIIEIRRHLNLGLVVSYIADDIHATQRQGQIVELKTTQAVLVDSATHHRLTLPYAALVIDGLPRRDDFRPGDTVSFTDQHLQEHVGTIVRINQKTASIQCDPNQGHWRVSFGLLRKIVDI